LTVLDTTISGNSSANEGGGIRKRFGSLAVERSTISGNTATNAGGGISAADGGVHAEIRDSTISGNVAGSGGGVFVYATSISTTITGSTISGNTARDNGGGIESFNSNLSVRHSTITSNRADSDSNSAGVGGGLFRNGGTVQLEHAIVANNQQGSLDNDIHSALVGTANFSLMEIVSGVAPVGTGNITGLDPLLGPLADNGGPTKTHALLFGSPAIDACDPDFDPADPDGDPMTDDALPYDQRGAPFVRVIDGDGANGARIDIGAVEFFPDDAVHALFGDYNRDFKVSAADYPVWRNSLGQMDVTPYSGADGDGDGDITLGDYSVWKAHYGDMLPMPGSGAATFVDESHVSQATPAPSHPEPLVGVQFASAAVSESHAELPPTDSTGRVQSPAWTGDMGEKPHAGVRSRFVRARREIADTARENALSEWFAALPREYYRRQGDMFTGRPEPWKQEAGVASMPSHCDALDAIFASYFTARRPAAPG
jgi:hypothetical protein